MKTVIVKFLAITLVGTFSACKIRDSKRSVAQEVQYSPTDVADQNLDELQQVDGILKYMEESIQRIFLVQTAIVAEADNGASAIEPKSIESSTKVGIDQLLSSVRSLLKIFEENSNDALRLNLESLQLELEKIQGTNQLAFAPITSDRNTEGLALGGYGQPQPTRHYGQLRVPQYVTPRVYTIQPTYVPPVYQVPVYVYPQPVYTVQPYYPQPSYYQAIRKPVLDQQLKSVNDRLRAMQYGGGY